MKALILCAGLGTRLRPLTDKIPKPMIEVAGKPVLEHLVDHLNVFGINEIIVNLHFKPGRIMSYFGTRLLYSYEPKLLGEEITLMGLSNWLKDDWFVVMNGDTLTNVNIKEMQIWGVGGSVAFMDGDTYAGTKILSPNYYYDLLDRPLPYLSNEYWFDIGTPKGLKKARQYYEKKISDMS